MMREQRDFNIAIAAIALLIGTFIFAGREMVKHDRARCAFMLSIAHNATDSLTVYTRDSMCAPHD